MLRNEPLTEIKGTQINYKNCCNKFLAETEVPSSVDIGMCHVTILMSNSGLETLTPGISSMRLTTVTNCTDLKKNSRLLHESEYKILCLP